MTTNNANSVPITKIVIPVLLLGVLLYLAVAHPWWLIGLIVLIVFVGRLLPGTALFDKMLQREESVELATKLSASQVALIFRDTLSGVSNHVKFTDINQRDSSPFGQFETQPDFAASASVIRKFNALNSWLLRLYIIDGGKDGREVFVVVVGSPKWARVLASPMATFSISQGWQQAEHVLEQLKRADPALQEIS